MGRDAGFRRARPDVKDADVAGWVDADRLFTLVDGPSAHSDHDGRWLFRVLNDVGMTMHSDGRGDLDMRRAVSRSG